MRRLWAWLRGSRRREEGSGAARDARVEAERKLREARRLWPQTRETRDRLAELIEEALRGNR